MSWQITGGISCTKISNVQKCIIKTNTEEKNKGIVNIKSLK